MWNAGAATFLSNAHTTCAMSAAPYRSKFHFVRYHQRIGPSVDLPTLDGEVAQSNVRCCAQEPSNAIVQADGEPLREWRQAAATCSGQASTEGPAGDEDDVIEGVDAHQHRKERLHKTIMGCRARELADAIVRAEASHCGANGDKQRLHVQARQALMVLRSQRILTCHRQVAEAVGKKDAPRRLRTVHNFSPCSSLVGHHQTPPSNHKLQVNY